MTLNETQKELLIRLLDFAEENFSAFEFRWSDATGEDFPEDDFDNLRSAIQED